MYKLYRLIIALVLIIPMSSCSDFLQEYSEDLAYAKTAQDLEELLIGECYMDYVKNSDAYLTGLEPTEPKYYLPMLHVMDDDIAEHTGSSIDGARTYFESFHNWQKNTYVYKGDEYEFKDWNKIYRHIATSNIVINKADEITDDPKKINRIKGECLFLRASYFFLLTNLYGKAYEEETAETELGIPLKLAHYIEDKKFRRNSVKECYERMVIDLKESIKLLEEARLSSVYRVNYFTANAFLSRVYLYMGQWQNAIDCAEIVLSDGSYSLEDLNGFTTDKSFICNASPGLIYSQGTHCMDFIMEKWGDNTYKVSDDLLMEFDESDLRNTVFFDVISSSEQTRRRCVKLRDRDHGVVSDIFSLRIAEMYLNMAEAYVNLGKDAQAIAMIRELRLKRIKSEDYSDIALAGADLAEFIRAERRRELCFEGHRWFDLKRYAVNKKFPFSKEIIHHHYSQVGVLDIFEYAGSYKLGKYEVEPAYQLQIPKFVIDFNDGMRINQPRPDRLIQK